MPPADNHCQQLRPRSSVGPDLDPNCLTLLVFLKEFFFKIDFEKNQQTTKMHAKLPTKKLTCSSANKIQLCFYFLYDKIRKWYHYNKESSHPNPPDSVLNNNVQSEEMSIKLTKAIKGYKMLLYAPQGWCPLNKGHAVIYKISITGFYSFFTTIAMLLAKLIFNSISLCLIFSRIYLLFYFD